jgi:agmatine deiminase
MKRFFTLLLSVSLCSSLFAQGVDSDILPKWSTEDELRYLETYGFNYAQNRGIEEPPPYDDLRSMAEWEEIQALSIAWTSYPDILKQIVQYAMEESMVIILSENVNQTQNYLENPNTGLGAITDFSNITIIDADYDSVWMRDYAGNPVYGSEVDDLVMVDWIYNRPNRPNDDASPEIIADHLGLDLYCITQAPTDLVNTGGNYMSDGFGTAFASELIMEENEAGNPYGVTVKSEDDIDAIMSDYLGIDTYVKMNTLPFDAIHHIDMHMKLIDEKTLLVGQFPENESDGPQIQANMEYVLSNFTNKWGEPYRIVWIPMPPSTDGEFPGAGWNSAYYRTYTNSVFVNKTIIMPTYREEYDTIAMNIMEKELPGYDIYGIDCDNAAETIIAASGAIHCITHSVGVEDPLLISHNSLDDTESQDPYLVNAYINHRTGVSAASMFWRLQGESDYSEVSMSSVGDNEWEADIPGQVYGSVVEYYIHATAESGKEQSRPMPAPEGFWSFKVLEDVVVIEGEDEAQFGNIYPNPASTITVIPMIIDESISARLVVVDALGREVVEIHSGSFAEGEQKFFLDASSLSAGVYSVVFSTSDFTTSQLLMVK